MKRSFLITVADEFISLYEAEGQGNNVTFKAMEEIFSLETHSPEAKLFLDVIPHLPVRFSAAILQSLLK